MEKEGDIIPVFNTAAVNIPWSKSGTEPFSFKSFPNTEIDFTSLFTL